MSFLRRIRYGLRVLLNRAGSDREIDDEVAHYREELAAWYRSSEGLSQADAERAARIATGSGLGIRDQVRAGGWEHWVTGMLDDFRYAARRLSRSPGLACAAVLTLALGIGATSAIFAVVDGVLWKPLPFPHAERLVALTHTAPGINLSYLRMSPSLYYTYLEESRVLEDLALWNGNRATVTGLGTPEEVPTLFVTSHFLDVLGVRPAIGRGFMDADGDPRGERTVILSDAYWRQQFGGSPDILGRRIMLDGNAHAIIGVLPPWFTFLDEPASLVVPKRLRREEVRLIQFGDDGIARLKPAVTLQQASADLARCLRLAPQKFPLNAAFAANTFADARIAPTLRILKDHQIGDIGKTLWILLGSVSILLLVACANVANLLLVRADGRQHELAIRNALGAGWGRIARDILAESLLLGIAGGALGIAFCFGALRWMVAIESSRLPRLTDISLDNRTLAFTLGTSIAAAFLFGLVPVWKYAIRDAHTRMHSAGGRSSTSSRERNAAQRTLLATQIALAVVLLAGSGLMLRTFHALRNVHPGFSDPDQVQIVRVSIPTSQIPSNERVTQMQEDILRKFSEVAGVSAVAITTSAPMQGGANNPVYAEGRDPAEGKVPPARTMRNVSPGFTAVLRSRLIAGRDFTWHDLHNGAPVALISENMARELWGDADAALRKRIRTAVNEEWRQVIGVVEDLHDDGITREAPAIVYWPLQQRNPDGSVSVPRNVDVMIRSTRAGSAQFVQELQRALQTVNADLPLANVRTLGSIYQRSMSHTSFVSILLTIAGGMALLLGIIGTYGVVAYAVTQRRKEIGIRIALGSTATSVTAMFVAQGLALALVGTASGVVCALWAASLMQSVLFGVQSFDPATYIAVVTILLACTVFASWLPARRAAGVDPAEALRAE